MLRTNAAAERKIKLIMQNYYGYGYTPANYPDYSPDPIERRQIKAVYSKCGWLLLINIGIMNVIVFVWTIINISLDLNSGTSDYYNAYDLAAGFFSPVIANIITIVICMNWGGSRIKDFFGTEKLTGRFILVSVAVFLGIQVIIVMVQNMLMSALDSVGLGVPSLDYETEKSVAAAVIGIISSSITAPIFEELLFRGYLLSFMSKVSTRFAIVISALFFGLFHGNIYQFILAFAGGLWLGYITVKSRSIIPAMISHCAANTVIECVSLISDYNEDLANGIFNIYVPVILLIAAAALIYYMKSLRKKMPPVKERAEYHRKRDFPIYLTSIPVWIYTILTVIQIFAGIKEV